MLKVVFNALITQGFRPTIAHYITKLTTFKGQVPQGTATSTSLVNLVFFHNVDLKLNKYCTLNEITYSRFVDDIINELKVKCFTF